MNEFLCCVVGLFLFTPYSLVYADQFDPTNLSIEQLMESQVTSVSRTEQNFSDTAAAVFVLTQDDIQRSGVTNIPDVLRMVPGIQVARISTNQWAVTARGFNGRFSNKMLVLVDGRAVYSPTFAGVRWENIDFVLEDIAKIEVIRGPGASVWGHNAVNGVINIISKHSEETRQGLFSVTTGNEERAIVSLRYGDQLNDNANYRVFGKFIHRDGLTDNNNDSDNDDWTQGRAGFRVDWNTYQGDRVMVAADGYLGETEKGFLLPTDNQNGPARFNREQNSGASLIVKWEHDLSIASKTQTQFYYEYFNENDLAFGSEKQHTYDLDFQHDIALSKDNTFNWGLGYRFVSDSVHDSKFATVRPASKDLHLVSTFVQDKITFFDDSLSLTLGTKIQYYTLTGWDYQPSARLLWKFFPEHRFWLSFSRSTRSPSRGETALGLRPMPVPNSPFPLNFVFQGNSSLEEERIYSYELGYRGWLGNHFAIDFSVFYNEYKNLVTGSVEPIDFINRQLPITFINGASAKTWGIEAAIDWRPVDPLRLQLAYSFLQVNVRQDINLVQVERPRTDPENQISFRSSYDVTSNISFDAWVRYIDSISALNTLFSPKRRVENYVSLDLRIAWKPIQNLEISVVGQNLNKKSHLQYVEEIFAYPRELERSVFAKVKWSIE